MRNPRGASRSGSLCATPAGNPLGVPAGTFRQLMRNPPGYSPRGPRGDIRYMWTIPYLSLAVPPGGFSVFFIFLTAHPTRNFTEFSTFFLPAGKSLRGIFPIPRRLSCPRGAYRCPVCGGAPCALSPRGPTLPSRSRRKGSLRTLRMYPIRPSSALLSAGGLCPPSCITIRQNGPEL